MLKPLHFLENSSNTHWTGSSLGLDVVAKINSILLQRIEPRYPTRRLVTAD